MVSSEVCEETLKIGEQIARIGQRAVLRAQEESRRKGVPNVYSIDGVLYWELPNGALSRTDPYSNSTATELDSTS